MEYRLWSVSLLMPVLPSFLKLLEEFALRKPRGAEAATALAQAEITQHSWCSADFRADHPEHHHPEGARKQLCLSPPERDRGSFTEQVAGWGLTRGRVSDS